MNLRGYRGLFALLWCGFAFTLVFSPISALFPLMTLDHFGGTAGDAAAAEIVFSVGMIAGSALLAATGGFRNRAYTVCFATALYGFATLAAGCAGPNARGMELFFVTSFLMGLSSPFYSGPQTALMQEKVPPEYGGASSASTAPSCPGLCRRGWRSRRSSRMPWARPCGLWGPVPRWPFSPA